MTRRIVTMLAMSALLLAMAAGSAFAQEGFDAEQCAEEIATSYAEGDEAAQALYEDRFAGLEGEELVTAVEEWLEENDLTLDDVCTIYGAVEVLPEAPEVLPGDPEEFEPEPETVPDPPAERPVPPVEPPVDAVPAEVLGISLQRTGIDAIVIALAGVTLLGLGLVAVRRTRPQSDAN